MFVSQSPTLESRPDFDSIPSHSPRPFFGRGRELVGKVRHQSVIRCQSARYQPTNALVFVDLSQKKRSGLYVTRSAAWSRG
jgi:hypothetical protein